MIVIVAGMALSIPIVAILADAYLKGKRITGGADVSGLQKQIEQLKKENTDLRERLHHVETIVTSRDYEALPPAYDDLTIAKKSEILAERVRKNAE